MRGKMDCHGLTDRGLVRDVNEDQFLVADLNKSMLIHLTSLPDEDHTRLVGGSQGKLLLVADGMGGHSAGKRASTVAVQTLARYVLNTMPWFYRLQESDEADLKDELGAALEACQKRIESEAQAIPERHGMGTTLTLAYILWPRLYVVHAGDSRCYLRRGPHLEQITHDHTVAQRLVDQGVLAPQRAAQSRWSHILWNCVGGGSHQLRPAVYKATLQVGDSLLLCTDGLTNQVNDRQILHFLQEEHSAADTCRRLIQAAKEAGGPDNITAVVAHFREMHALHARAGAATAAAAEPETSATVNRPGQPIEVARKTPLTV